ncbi:MAG: YjbQ family protein [Clostridiales bacterium]|jgi:secondary thiamine-phosphate synthase enzyme|nr:YjbQ family protein [Clostridiales bacterium]
MVYAEQIELQSNDKAVTFHNITDQVKEIVKKSGVTTGTVTVYSHHTTCCVITQEAAFDMSMTGLETLQQDFVNSFHAIMPNQYSEGVYLHPGPKALAYAEQHGEDARGCHNTDAHLRSALVGRSEVIVILEGEVDLGDFGFIYFIDFDQTRARKRKASILVMGE